MADLPTRLDLYSIGRRYVVSRARRIDPAQIDVEGSDVNLFVGSSSFMAHAVTRQIGTRVNALTLDGAEREDLDRLLIDWYMLPRKGASAAVVPLVFERPTAAMGAGSLPVGTKIRTTTGIEYVTLDVTAFGASTLKVTGIRARAVQAGKEFQVGANALRRFAVTPWDASLTVNNATAAVGGEPAESDSVYRERGRGYWPSARRGTLAAIAYGALSVVGVDSAIALETLDNGDPARLVELYSADSSGMSNDVLLSQVADALEEYRAGGIHVVQYGSTPLMVDIQLSLSFRAGVDTSTLTGKVRQSMVDYVNSLGVSDPLLMAALQAILMRYASSGVIASSGSIVEPVGDLFPTVGRTLRTRLENVTTV